MSYQDDIEKALVDRFLLNAQGIEWERVEAYPIDNAARMKRFAIGLTDQGQKFKQLVGLSDQVWRVAVEFFCRCDSTADIKTVVNDCRATIFKTMMSDVTLVTATVPDGMLIDTMPVVDEIYVDRLKNEGEGAMIFDLTYRTPMDDIGVRWA